MKNSFWKEVFMDIDGSFSFKRVQTAIFTILFTIVVVSDLFWQKHLSENLVDFLVALTAYGYTGIMIEKFTKRGQDAPKV